MCRRSEKSIDVTEWCFTNRLYSYMAVSDWCVPDRLYGELPENVKTRKTHRVNQNSGQRIRPKIARICP